MPLPVERILRCVTEPPLCVRANQRDGIAPIPDLPALATKREVRPKAAIRPRVSHRPPVTPSRDPDASQAMENAWRISRVRAVRRRGKSQIRT
jgi:hypothetical protein